MSILDFASNDINFSDMYNLRKDILKDLEESNVLHDYVLATIEKGKDRVYYLTDNTILEKHAIIESLDGATTIPTTLTKIYPALSEYLNDFKFKCVNAELLTKYFSEYKRQKLTNRISDDFYNKDLEFAVDGSSPYNLLKTRGEDLDKIDHKNTTLYWIDALGAEFIGYIQSRSQNLGLKIYIHVVRSNLPTITSLNKDFFYSWSGVTASTKNLDIVKHKAIHDYNYGITKSPIHLATELSIIDDFLKWTVDHLKLNKAKKVLLVSDHGSSRLAVINEQECKLEMTSKGEYSGRCCPCCNEDVKFEYATQENGYWVLANYDRFKGSRKANVEVHGGATLEEVVIPIIEFELHDDNVSITNLTPITKTSFKKDAEIVLLISCMLSSVSVRINGKHYSVVDVGDNKHKIILSDINKSGKYIADVFEGDNLIGQVNFEVQRESASSNDQDWFK
jgi:hypothetical protein